MTRDIIVRFDEETGKLVCSTVDKKLTGLLLQQALPLEISVVDLRAKGPDEAERALGAGIFALIDLHTKQKIGLRDYKTLADNWALRLGQELEQKADKGDSVAKYELALQLVAEGLSAKSRSKMELAHQLLVDAVALGNLEAKDYLDNLWPTLKARADRTFK